MSNQRRNRRAAKGSRQGMMGKARAQMMLAAHVTEEQDWYLDTPDVRLTRIFAVVVLLHAVAVGGILAYKMVDKAAETSSVTISTAREPLSPAVQETRQPAASAGAYDAPARQAPPAPLRPDPTKGGQYKVMAGDKLPDIAKAHGVAPEALRAENLIISDSELYPGRWIAIPSAAKAAEMPVAQPVATPVAAAAPAAPAPAAEARPSVYEVRPGDTPWAIARKFNVTFNQLMSENGITNAQTLQIGQKLRIPAGN